MSWLNPPIEKVIESAGNKYILCSLVSKRAKELLLNKAEFFKENHLIEIIQQPESVSHNCISSAHLIEEKKESQS